MKTMTMDDCCGCKYMFRLIGLGLGVRCTNSNNQQYKTKEDNLNMPVVILKVPYVCHYKEPNEKEVTVIQNKRVNNLEYTITDFPPKPKRDIKYALVRDGYALYFINQSTEVIDEVSASSFGYLTVEDTVYSPENEPCYSYQDVQPGEAVLIEDYSDERVFNDYMLGLYIYIKNKDGDFRIKPISHKGGVRSQILVYGDGSSPRYVLNNKGIENCVNQAK